MTRGGLDKSHNHVDVIYGRTLSLAFHLRRARDKVGSEGVGSGVGSGVAAERGREAHFSREVTKWRVREEGRGSASMEE